MKKDTEIWVPSPSIAGGLVSDLGRVLLPPSYAPMNNGGYRSYLPEPRYGSEAYSKKGAAHRYMNIVHRGETFKVHFLICEAFHGLKPFEGAVVMHINEDALDNRPANIRWGTQKENLNAPGFKAYCRARTGENSPTSKYRAGLANTE